MTLTFDIEFSTIWAYKPNERMTIVVMEGAHLDNRPSIHLMTIIINRSRNYYLINQGDVEALLTNVSTDAILYAARSPIYMGIKTQDLNDHGKT